MDFQEFSRFTYRKLKKIFIENLIDYYGEQEAQSVFYYWMMERNQWTLKDWVLHLDEKLRFPEILWKDYQNLLKKMPVHYVVEKAYFMGLPFYVNSSVLIPRPETEGLVRQILSKYSQQAKGKIIEVGSGSGCIAIALKKELKNFDVQSIEVSQEAIEVAQKNAHCHQVKIDWINQSIFDFKTSDFENVEVVVSNPPYVPLSEKEELKEHVKNFEPSIALFSGENPLIFYEKITELAASWLKNTGLLAFEVHFQYAHNVKTILQKFHFQDIEIILDDFGKERIVLGTK